jgi:hypothetical protein
MVVLAAAAGVREETRAGNTSRRCGGSSSRGAHGGERQQGKRKVVGFIGAQRPGIWQARTRRRIGLGLVPESGLPKGETRLG